MFRLFVVLIAASALWLSACASGTAATTYAVSDVEVSAAQSEAHALIREGELQVSTGKAQESVAQMWLSRAKANFAATVDMDGFDADPLASREATIKQRLDGSVKAAQTSVDAARRDIQDGRAKVKRGKALLKKAQPKTTS